MKIFFLKLLVLLSFLFLINAVLGQEAIDVRVTGVEPDDKELIVNKVGYVKPFSSLELSVELEGTVEKLNVEVGNKVKKGQTLALINTSFMRIDRDEKKVLLDQAKFLYEKQKLNYETAFQGSSISIDEVLKEIDITNIPDFNPKNLQIQQALNNFEQIQTKMDVSRALYEKEKQIFERELDLKRSLEGINQARLRKELAQDERDRNKKLLEREIISQTQLDNIENQLELTKSQLELARIEHENLLASRNSKLLQFKNQWESDKKQLDSIRIGLAQSLINLDSGLKNSYFQYQRAELAHKLSQRNYQKSILRAPFKGIVQEKYYDELELAKKGSTAFEVVNLDKVIVSIGVNESNIQYFKKGRKTFVRFDAILNSSVEGIISKVAVKADRTSRTYDVEITVNNKEGLIRNGMSARVDFVLKELKKQIFIPLHAVIEKGERRTVYIVRDGISEEVTVETGEVIQEEVHITKGLKLGDQLVVQGHQFLVAGSLVKIIN